MIDSKTIAIYCQVIYRQLERNSRASRCSRIQGWCSGYSISRNRNMCCYSRICLAPSCSSRVASRYSAWFLQGNQGKYCANSKTKCNNKCVLLSIICCYPYEEYLFEKIKRFLDELLLVFVSFRHLQDVLYQLDEEGDDDQLDSLIVVFWEFIDEFHFCQKQFFTWNRDLLLWEWQLRWYTFDGSSSSSSESTWIFWLLFSYLLYDCIISIGRIN